MKFLSGIKSLLASLFSSSRKPQELSLSAQESAPTAPAASVSPHDSNENVSAESRSDASAPASEPASASESAPQSIELKSNQTHESAPAVSADTSDEVSEDASVSFKHSAAPQSDGSAVSVKATGRRYDPTAVNDENAQRLARLLVSEIKLYYANKSSHAGETDSLYEMLKDPIEKSRQHYRERMGAAANAMPDYFHQELVRSLCNGDASLLGPNYEP